MKEKIHKLKKAVAESYNIRTQRAEVFISPDKTIAIVMHNPLTGMFEFEPGFEGIEIRYVPEKVWKSFFPANLTVEFLEGAFSLHDILFPAVPLDISFARMKNWCFVKEKFF